ncbi:flippase [Megasphaera sueciensis]|uniref:flippase n=1 Tax=Megasphaera sueciensis TaxID=349094 RepID=UPI003CFF4556
MVIKIKPHKLSENIASLLGLKGLEYILNFILLPFLVRVLGVERFGAIAFMQGIVQYFIILVDYGFNMTAPRDIARAKSTNEVAQIFSNVITSKIIICFISTILFLSGLVIFQSYVNIDILLFFAVYTMVIGNIVFPIWFFQGIQQMRYITIVNILARIITVSLILLFVRRPEDYLLAAFLQACTTVFAGAFSFYVLYTEYRFVFCHPTICKIKKTLINGWHIFLSTIAINIYTATNLVILGLITNNTVVGYFSAANKIIDSVKGLMNTVTQAVYPHVSQLLCNSREHAITFLHKFLKIYCGLNLLGSVLLFALAWIIVRILFGLGYEESMHILQIMALLPAVISVSNVFGIQTMLNFGWQKEFSKILVGAAIFNLIIVVPLAIIWHGEGVAVSMVLTELLVTICTSYFILKVKHINLLEL